MGSGAVIGPDLYEVSDRLNALPYGIVQKPVYSGGFFDKDGGDFGSRRLPADGHRAEARDEDGKERAHGQGPPQSCDLLPGGGLMPRAEALPGRLEVMGVHRIVSYFPGRNSRLKHVYAWQPAPVWPRADRTKGRAPAPHLRTPGCTRATARTRQAAWVSAACASCTCNWFRVRR